MAALLYLFLDTAAPALEEIIPYPKKIKNLSYCVIDEAVDPFSDKNRRQA
jgi:hypothetical protein